MPLRRARRSLALLLGALVLSLAACTGGADEPPSPPATATATPTATASPTPTSIATPTPTATSTPAPSPTATPAATPTPTEIPAPTPAATPTPTEIPAPTPTATETPSSAPTTTPTPTTAAVPTPTASPAPASTATPTPTPTARQTTFRYDTYDLTGETAEPGSYSFLANAADTSSAVTTYEGLRDGTATALRIHETDADGASQAALYDAVEAGDTFEWRHADDCWVGYKVTEVKPDPAGAVPRKLLAVEWYGYAYTGCSGTITASAASAASVAMWREPLVWGGPDLTYPVVYGVFQVVPEGWTGELDLGAYVAAPGDSADNPGTTENLTEARQLPYWRDLPGWTFEWASSGGLDAPVYGYCARLRKADPATGAVEVCASHAAGRANPSRTKARFGATVEVRVVNGHPALLYYYPPTASNWNPISRIEVIVYNAATESIHTIVGWSENLRGSNVEAVLEVARTMFPSTPPQTTFRYDTYDLTGETAEPGSYAFLADAADTSSAVTTYEGLRDGTATALRIHETDAVGVSRAAFLDTIEVGDLFEWHEAEDCFVRYKVTELLPEPSGPPRRLLAVEWMTFTYTGCSGAISASDNVQIVWGPLPNLGGESLSVPVVHGPYEIVPLDWSGETMRDYVPFPDYSDPVETDDITVARTLDFWREPTIPEGWTFGEAIAAGGDAYGGARWGYCATWWAKNVKIPNTTVVHPQRGVQICADFTSTRYGNQDASWNNGSAVHETRVIARKAGKPQIQSARPQSPSGFPDLDPGFRSHDRSHVRNRSHRL